MTEDFRKKPARGNSSLVAFFDNAMSAAPFPGSRTTHKEASMSSGVTFTLCSGSNLSAQTNQFDPSWLSSTRKDFERLYPTDEEDKANLSLTGRDDLDRLYTNTGEVEERKPVRRFRINATVKPEEAAEEEKKLTTSDNLDFDSFFGDDGIVYKKGSSLDTTV